MALTIICVSGPSNTGKSCTISRFTAEHLKYKKAKGDVLGIFPMPKRGYAVGVNGYGDNLEVVRDGLEFMHRYRGLKVIIVASHTHESETYRAVKRFAKKVRATLLPPIKTVRLDRDSERKDAIRANVAKIKRLMPSRAAKS